MNIDLWTKTKAITPSLTQSAVMASMLFIGQVSGINANEYDPEQLNSNQMSNNRVFINYGVTLQYIESIAKLGFDHLSHGELIAFKELAINAAYIEKIQKIGLSNMGAGELIGFSAHDIDANYVDEIRLLGFSNINAGEVIAFKA